MAPNEAQTFILNQSDFRYHVPERTAPGVVRVAAGREGGPTYVAIGSAPEIYWISGSPFSWRVLLTAEVKGIPYEGKLLRVSKGDLKTPKFLAINPLGRAPALRDGDFTLHWFPCDHGLSGPQAPSPPLFGRTAEEAGRIFQCISEFDLRFRAVQPTADPLDPLWTATRCRGGGE